MERLETLEEVLVAYINQNFPEAEVTILNRIDNVPQNEIIEAIKGCDMILAQSIFDTTFDGLDGIKSFMNMIDLFKAVPSLRRPAHIIHTTQKLIYFLNFTLPPEYRYKVEDMLKEGLELYNVHFAEFAGKKEEGVQYFKPRTTKVFDTVKMWYDEKNHWIYDEHLFFIPDITINAFKKQAYFLEHPPKQYKAVKTPTAVKPVLAENTLISMLSAKELITLKQMLEEEYQRTTEIIEDIENGHCHASDADEKADLLKCHRGRIKVLDKMGITSYR